MELFPSKEERSKLVKSDVYTKICEIIDSLPEPKSAASAQLNSEDFSGRILVRLPKSVHASLAQEAQLEGVSLNQLIVAKLSVQLAAVV
jgi:predicted HicB family RNase H-like nuclease